MVQTSFSVEQRTATLPSADGLFVFLDGLRREGYHIDARQIAAAQCLLAEARTEGTDSPAARRIKYRLAPLIAKLPSQQQDFYRRYDALCGAPVVLGRIGPESRATSGPATEAVKRDRRGWVIAGVVTAFLGLATAVTLYFSPPPPPQPAEATVAASPRPAQPGEAYDLPQARFETVQEVVFPVYAGLKPALAAAPLLAFVAWLVMRWRRRLLLILRGVVLGDADLAGVRLPLKLSEVLFTGPELRASAHDLRKHRFLPTRKLDARATVDATARRAGLFTPVYRERLQLPEYVFLIEQNGTNDHLARLFDLAVARLRDEHVEIQRYYFHTDPRQLQADDRDRSIVPLAELTARTSDCRLFIIGTADGFFHPLTGGIESWVQQLEPWRSRTILSTRSLEQWTMAELRLLEEGFSLATAEASGFAATGAKVAVGDDTAELLEGVLVTPEPTLIAEAQPDLLTTQPRPLRLFIFYAHEDDLFRRKLETHLSPLKRQGFVEVWSDRAIEAGQEREQNISQQLKIADIILLLISPDFLALEYIYENELTGSIERHKAGEARVIPVFLRPCYWKDEVFGKLQGVPDDAKPISRWEDHDEAFQAVARAIRQAVGSLRSLQVERRPEPDEKTRHASPLAQGQQMAEIFISYSHKDEMLRDELVIHLKILERQRLIRSWHDRKITAGTEWKGQIDSDLEHADIILLLVSADFIASEYCYDVEMRQALQRHEEGSARVIPIIIRDVNWQYTPFGKLKALPEGGRAVAAWGPDRYARDTAWKNVAESIERILKDWKWMA